MCFLQILTDLMQGSREGYTKILPVCNFRGSSFYRKLKTIKKIAKYNRVASFMEGVHNIAPQGH